MERELTVGSTAAKDIEPGGDPRYRVGTLQYTKAGLVMLFFWLLWGDFCYYLMETVEPSILPFMMNKLNAPNTVISLFLTTIPSLMNFLLNPIISVKSDRYRSRWGRRIPFLAIASPFIAFFLILTGFAPEISVWLHAHIFSSIGLSPQFVAIGFIGILVVGFRFFNMFISTVFYYLFNDVVPEHFLGRFTTGFRVVGVTATFSYQWFIFKYAEDHARWIFLGISLLYLVGFALMCLKVKEGEYPPPPEITENNNNLLANVKTYFRECFSIRFYQVWFLVYGLYVVASCANPFLLLMKQRALGLSMEQLGHLSGIGSVLSFIVLFPAGVLSDRYHPFRVFIVSMIGVVLTNAIFAVLVIGFRFSEAVMYKVLLGYIAASLPLNSIAITALLPLGMKLVPREKYGQFCSAGAMAGALLTTLGVFIVGAFMDYVKNLFNGGADYFRYVTLWYPLVYLLCLIFALVCYRMWKKRGGDKDYTPPDPVQYLRREKVV